MRAALSNPQRKLIKLSATQNALVRLEIPSVENLGIPFETVTPQDLDKILGPEAIHQGVMLETRPLPPRRLEALKDSPLILVLDQVTDPHNVGAIMRSAAAFNACAIVTQDRHAPPESGTLATIVNERQIRVLFSVSQAELLNVRRDLRGRYPSTAFAQQGVDCAGGDLLAIDPMPPLDAQRTAASGWQWLARVDGVVYDHALRHGWPLAFEGGPVLLPVETATAPDARAPQMLISAARVFAPALGGIDSQPRVLVEIGRQEHELP